MPQRMGLPSPGKRKKKKSLDPLRFRRQLQDLEPNKRPSPPSLGISSRFVVAVLPHSLRFLPRAVLPHSLCFLPRAARRTECPSRPSTSKSKSEPCLSPSWPQSTSRSPSARGASRTPSRSCTPPSPSSCAALSGARLRSSVSHSTTDSTVTSLLLLPSDMRATLDALHLYASQLLHCPLRLMPRVDCEVVVHLLGIANLHSTAGIIVENHLLCPLLNAPASSYCFCWNGGSGSHQFEHNTSMARVERASCGSGRDGTAPAWSWGSGSIWGGSSPPVSLVAMD